MIDYLAQLTDSIYVNTFLLTFHPCIIDCFAQMINIVDAFFYVVNGCLEVVVSLTVTECVLHIRWVANAAIIVLDDDKLKQHNY